MNNKIAKTVAGAVVKGIAKASYHEAFRNANQSCVFLHGQPEMPEQVKALSKIKTDK